MPTRRCAEGGGGGGGGGGGPEGDPPKDNAGLMALKGEAEAVDDEMMRISEDGGCWVAPP